MLRTAALALALGVGAMGITSSRASAQAIVGGGVYLAAPPVYVEVGPPPGPGYVWVPGHRRWEYRHFDRDDFRRYRDYARGYRDFDRGYRDFDRGHRDFDRGHRDFDRGYSRDRWRGHDRDDRGGRGRDRNR